MKPFVNCLVALGLAFSFSTSCFAATPAKKAAKKPIPEATVLVSVNGEPVTMGDLNRYTGMMAALMKNKKPKGKQADIDKFLKQRRKSYSDALLRRKIITTALAPSNLVATAEIRAAKEAEFVRTFGRRGQTFAQIRDGVAKAGYGKELDESFNFDLLLQTYVDTVVSNEFYVSEQDLVKTRAYMAKYNERAQATNVYFRAQAEKVLKLAREPGADFAKLADEYSMDDEKEPGGALGDCDESDFLSEKDVWRKINALKAGDVSDVVETEEGYVIFKAVKRNTAEESDTGSPSVTLARIFFRQAYVYPEQTDDELRVDVAKEKKEACYSKIYSECRKCCTLTYPDGKITSN